MTMTIFLKENIYCRKVLIQLKAIPNTSYLKWQGIALLLYSTYFTIISLSTWGISLWKKRKEQLRLFLSVVIGLTLPGGWNGTVHRRKKCHFHICSQFSWRTFKRKRRVSRAFSYNSFIVIRRRRSGREKGNSLYTWIVLHESFHTKAF